MVFISRVSKNLKNSYQVGYKQINVADTAGCLPNGQSPLLPSKSEGPKYIPH